MKRFLLAIVTIALTASVHGQATFPPAGSIEGDGFTTLNRYNLGYTFRIALPSVPSRGVSFSPGITYNSFVWQLNGSVWSPVSDTQGNPTWGWNRVTPPDAGLPLFTTLRWRCVANDSTNQWTYEYENFHTTNLFFDIDVRLAERPDDYPECSDGSPQTGYGHDSGNKPNGYYLVLNGNGGPNATPPPGTLYPPNYNNTRPTIFAPSGVQVDDTGGTHDTNGNSSSSSTSGSTTTYFDSIGRTALTVTDSTSPHQTTYSYYDASHTLQTATMALTSMSVYSSLQCSGVSEFSASTVYFPTSLTLADGSTYTFTYELSSISGHTSATTGRLAQITLPTGGYIQYAYTGINCADGSPTQVTKTVNDLASSSTWTYVRTSSSGIWITKETTPQNNDTQTTFNSDGLPTVEKVYQASVGGTVLRETDTSYDADGVSTVDVIVGAKSKTIAYLHDSYGNLDTQYEYDWNTTSSPIRTTVLLYYWPTSYVSGNFVNLVREKKVTTATAVVSDTEYFYDGLNHDGSTDTSAIAMTSVTGAAGHDDSNYCGTCTTPRGNLTRSVSYITPGVTSTGPLTTLYGYDSLGNLVDTKDPNGNETLISYVDSWDSGTSGCSIGSGSAGARAYPTSITQGYGSGISITSTATYSKCVGQPITMTDANSETTTYAYADALLRPTSVNYPDNTSGTPTITYGYNHFTSPSTKATATVQTLRATSASATQTTTLDGLGRAFEVESGALAKVDYVYGFDTTNHYVSQGVSNAYTSGSPVFSYSYTDPLGRPVKSVLADGSSTASASYSDNCTTSTDPAGANRKLCYDVLGRLQDVYEDPNGISGSTPLNYHTQYLYDFIDDLIAVCQGNSFSGTSCPSGSLGRTFTYDGLGRLTSETTPEAGTTNYYYTNSSGGLCSGAVSQLCRATDALSVAKTYSYDALNRMTGKSYSDSTSAVTYSYDQSSYNSLTIANGKGQRTGMSDGSGATAWSFDPVGRVAKIKKLIHSTTDVTHEADYNYYYDGALNTLLDFGGTTYTYGYNSYQQLSSITDGTNTYASGATYQASGALATLTHQLTSGSTSLTRSFAPTTNQEPSVIQAYPTSSPSSPFMKLTYAYGSGTDNGNMSSITDGATGHSGRTQSFTYDVLNRLQTASSGTAWGETYGYDQFGNLTGETHLSGTTTGSTWSATATNNRLSVNSYNANGTAGTVNGSVSYVYDAEGRILSSNSSPTYLYDGDGYRVKMVGSSTTLYWPGASGQILDESNGGATSFGRQVWFGSLLVWNEDTSGNGRFLFQDHLGSTRVTANSSGTVLDDIDYEPFGAVLANHGGAATNNHYNFTGYETDDDLSNYATFRNTDPIHGRFNRPDPYLGSYDFSDPQSLNRYSYVRNRPLMLTDPIGMDLSDGSDIGCGGDLEPDCFVDDPSGGGGGGGGDGVSTTVTVDVTATIDESPFTTTDLEFPSNIPLIGLDSDGPSSVPTVPLTCAQQRVLAGVPGATLDTDQTGATGHGGHQTVNIIVSGNQLAADGYFPARNIFGGPNGFRNGAALVSVHVNARKGQASNALVPLQGHTDIFNFSANPFTALGHIVWDLGIGSILSWIPGLHHNTLLDPGCPA